MVIFSVLITFYAVFRSTGTQTLIVRLAADYYSKVLKTDIRIRSFDISLKYGLILEDILIRDLHRSVIFSAHELGLAPGRINFKKHTLNIHRIYIDNGTVQLLTHQGDSVLNLQFILDYFTSKNVTIKTDTATSPVWKLSVSSVSLKNTRFHFQDENEPLQLSGMDYSNIDVSGIDLDLTDVKFVGDTIHANIRHLAARERCGFILRSMSGEFQVGPAFLKAHNLKILTDHSDLALTFDFLYKSWSGFNDFLNAVTIQAKIEPSYLDLQDIGYFAPELMVMKDRCRIAGDIKGTVSNFKAKNFRIAFGLNTYFYGNISALGLPNVEETFIDLNIKSMETNKIDIESFLIPTADQAIALPAIFENIGVVGIRGNFTGFYNDFVANAHLRTNLGNINTDLTLKKQKNSPLIGYKGQLDLGHFDIGKLVDDPKSFGRVTARADINGQGLDLETADLSMNLRIDSLRLLDYNYINLDVTGILAEKKFSGTLAVDDPNLDLGFKGMVDLSDSLPVFDFTAKINKAKLFNLHFWNRDSVLEISTRLEVDATGTNLDNLEGSIFIDSTVYREGDKLITMDHLSLLTTQNLNQQKTYQLRSDFIDADFDGSFYFRDLIPSMSMFIKNYLASFTLRDSLIDHHPGTDQRMDYRIKFKDTDEVMAVFLPFLHVADSSSLTGFYDEEKGSMVMKGKASSVVLFGMKFSHWYLDAESLRDNLHIETGCSVFYLKNEKPGDSLQIKLDSLSLVSNIRQDSIKYDLSWSDQGYKSELDGFASFFNSPKIELKLGKFNVYAGFKYWKVDTGNYLVLDTSRILIHDLGFSSNDQFLKFDGNISRLKQDTLDVSFNKVDISELDRLFLPKALDLDGILSGQIKLHDLYNNFSVLADLKVDRLKFNDELLGDAVFSVKYNTEAAKFDVNSRILYTGNAGTNIPFMLSGSYYLDKTNPHLDFNLGLKNLNLRMIRPFVSSFMSGVDGFASGQVKILGTFEKPVLSGQIKLMRTELKINYLNVPYTLSDVVTIDSNSFHFDNIVLFDSLGNKAVLNGKITHQYFSDLRLGLNIELNDFSAFHNSRAQNSIFYGVARGSGTVSITGPIDHIAIRVKAQTGANTHVVIPIDMTQSLGQNDYIIFVQDENDSVNGKTPRKTNTSGITLDLGVLVNPTAEVEVFFPDQLGNLKATGTGNLQMDMTPTTPFTLSGIYFLKKGSFLFTLQNLLRLPMTIKEGSQISWTGDPADANISVSAVYKTKAALKGLTTESSEEGIRIPVECIIRLTGKLLNPDISFGINLPNVEENIRSVVFSAIDTNNASEMTQQVVYLMVMNQFKPIVSTGSSVDVGATSMSLVTNQINSWLSQISQNVNVGVNYHPATSSTKQEFDVALSTQLFDDRLLIDGTFGMNSYNNQSYKQSSTIVGDINIEYLLTKNRRWRVHAFNRTNTLTILNNNSQYTQGVGITYQRDFTNFKEIFKRAKKTEK